MRKSKTEIQKSPEIASVKGVRKSSAENQNIEVDKDNLSKKETIESSDAQSSQPSKTVTNGNNAAINDPEIKVEIQEIADNLQPLPEIQDDRISLIIENQKELLLNQTENLALLNQRFIAAEKKFYLIKKALKKAKNHKLQRSAIRLIKFEKKQAKKEREQFKRLIKKESRGLKNVRKIILLLKNIH